MNAKQLRGQTSYHAGVAAEAIVAKRYTRAGCEILAQRWRGSAGEIDLIAQNDEGVIFIEVKKSRSIAGAAERLSKRQMQRIYAAAGEFLSGTADGQMKDVRFDVAI